MSFSTTLLEVAGTPNPAETNGMIPDIRLAGLRAIYKLGGPALPGETLAQREERSRLNLLNPAGPKLQVIGTPQLTDTGMITTAGTHYFDTLLTETTNFTYAVLARYAGAGAICPLVSNYGSPGTAYGTALYYGDVAASGAPGIMQGNIRCGYATLNSGVQTFASTGNLIDTNVSDWSLFFGIGHAGTGATAKDLLGTASRPDGNTNPRGAAGSGTLLIGSHRHTTGNGGKSEIFLVTIWEDPVNLLAEQLQFAAWARALGTKSSLILPPA
ncbi:hypothetical protein SAMN02745194_03148 [Roseomonas rosea]|uniref:Uncharacterized protein n=1 Tax=Muricoccus roseus TaxID=198092 RepID=A0A1M6LED7_9PROT|nr:hypothetical protein [Roseomonas rosea]SHJ69581.1 hypothetical protein SAMN02745194_03148 [Roseomonas rosea]